MNRKRFCNILFLFFIIFCIYIQKAYALKIAVINFKPEFGETKLNTNELLRLNKEAAKNGAELIINPELAIIGDLVEMVEMYQESIKQKVSSVVVSVPGKFTQKFIELAKESKTYIVLGAAEVDELKGSMHNCAIFIGPDGLVGKITKINPSISIFSKGELPVQTFNISMVKVSILICGDVFFPELVEQLKDSSILILPMMCDFRQPDPFRYLRKIARNKRLFIAIANGTKFGDSYVINAEGKIDLRVSQNNSIGYIDINIK